MHVRHAGIAALALAALTFAAAGCGGGGPTAAVANVATTTNTIIVRLRSALRAINQSPQTQDIQTAAAVHK